MTGPPLWERSWARSAAATSSSTVRWSCFVPMAPVIPGLFRGDRRRNLLAGVVGRGQRRLERRKITLQPLADRPLTAAQTVRQATPAAFQKTGVQCLEALEHRNRHQKGPPRIADQTFDLAL